MRGTVLKALTLCSILAIGTAHAETPAIYRVEVIFVHDGEVFLGQQSLPTPEGDRLRAVAFDDEGEALPPPDPGFRSEKLKRVEIQFEGSPPKPPPPPPDAESTRYYGAEVHGDRIGIRVSDVVMTLTQRPMRGGKPILYMREGALFRIERVDVAPPSLLQDRQHYEQRVRQILDEARQHLATLRAD